MTEKILNNNQVVVAGEIVSDFRFSHEIFGEGFYMVDLVVSRLSDAHDVIPLMVSDRLFDVEKSRATPGWGALPRPRPVPGGPA